MGEMSCILDLEFVSWALSGLNALPTFKVKLGYIHPETHVLFSQTLAGQTTEVSVHVVSSPPGASLLTRA